MKGVPRLPARASSGFRRAPRAGPPRQIGCRPIPEGGASARPPPCRPRTVRVVSLALRTRGAAASVAAPHCVVCVACGRGGIAAADRRGSRHQGEPAPLEAVPLAGEVIARRHFSTGGRHGARVPAAGVMPPGRARGVRPVRSARPHAATGDRGPGADRLDIYPRIGLGAQDSSTLGPASTAAERAREPVGCVNPIGLTDGAAPRPVRLFEPR
jgi:hypothetical protein